MRFSLFLSFLQFSSAVKICRDGEKLFSTHRIRYKNAGKFGSRLHNSCRMLQRPECVEKCTWALTCRQTHGWYQYNHGLRTYIAGIRERQNDIELYCCISMAIIADTCSFTDIRSDEETIVQLEVFQVLVNFDSQADTIVRDVISKTTDRSTPEYRVEICRIRRERHYCHLHELIGSQREKFRILLLRTNRRNIFSNFAKVRAQEESLKRFRENLFTTTTVVPPLPVRRKKIMPKREEFRRKKKNLNSGPKTKKRKTKLTTPVSPKFTQECPKSDFSPCISVDEANFRFQWCCAALVPNCAPICYYNTTQSQITSLIVSGRCPLSEMGKVLRCASEDNDVTPCCHIKGVLDNKNFCSPFCNPSAHNVNFNDFRNIPCIHQVGTIALCFRAYQKP